MIIEIEGKEADKKRSALRITIGGKSFYKVCKKSNIEENFIDYADYVFYCLTEINQAGILENERPQLESPLQFEERQERKTNEEKLKEMLGNIKDK